MWMWWAKCETKNCNIEESTTKIVKAKKSTTKKATTKKTTTRKLHQNKINQIKGKKIGDKMKLIKEIETSRNSSVLLKAIFEGDDAPTLLVKNNHKLLNI